jgi:hypothetical protein
MAASPVRPTLQESAKLREDIVKDDLVSHPNEALQIVAHHSGRLSGTLCGQPGVGDVVRTGCNDRGGQRPAGGVAQCDRVLIEPRVEVTPLLNLNVV